MHKVGFVHRDIKSSNIIIDEDDSIRIIDLASRGHTNPWRDPECNKNKLYNNNLSQDIHSFGIVLWELCTGIHPSDQSTVDLSLALNSSAPSFISNLVSECTRERKERISLKDLAKRFEIEY